MSRHRQQFRRAITAGSGLVSLAIIAPAQAQDLPVSSSTSTDASGDELAEIVVTATKRSENLRNVPISISAENGTSLARRGAVQLDDIVANAPGLSNAGGGANQANLVVRGVTTGVTSGLQQSTVALFIDDLPADPGAGGLSTTDLRLFDIRRVEVLRGPQGTLFGSGSLSGAVRIITNKPEFSDYSAKVQASVRTTSGGDMSEDIDAMVNLPLVDGKVAIRAVGYTGRIGGVVDNRLTGRNDVDWVRQSGGRLMIGIAPSEQLSLLLTGMYQDSRTGSTGYSSYVQPAGRNRSRASLVEPAVDLENLILNLVGRYDLGSVELTSSTSYSRKDLLAIGNAGAYVTLLGGALGIPDLVEPAETVTPSQSRTFTQEVRFSSIGNGPFRWTVGGYYQHIDGDGGQTIDSPTIGTLVGISSIQDVQTSSIETERALFGEATYTIGDRLDLTAGVRVGRSRVAFTTHSTGVLVTGSFSPDVIIDTIGEQSETTVNPRFAVTYRPNDNWTVYAQASRGFRTGGPNLTAGLSPTPPPFTYKSDSLWNYEIGQRARLAGGALQLNATLYYIDWSNIQASLYRGISYIGNAGDARVYGFEAELAAVPVRGVEVGGSLSLSRGELTKDVPDISRVSGQVGAHDGDRLPANPGLKIAAYGQVNFTVAQREVYLRADTQYVGRQYSDFGKLGVPFGDFTTVNLRAGVRLSGVELVAFATNLFNSNGKMSAVDGTHVGGVLLGEAGALRVRPRTLGITVRGDF
ncbi:TonB-dependent receptor [Sphingomonas sp. ERG5]|uniref:TonB-dependent receptor n=1 Tax=Sphingomonas sp. ERG5 TaxID=1381597 RepID=UPI001364CB29|nr:TonB-dependent receptor [Sphingomonas sp. ERG5]